MKSKNEHWLLLKEVADLALSSGLKYSGIDFSSISDIGALSKEQYAKFIQTCHKGFKDAQSLIIKEVKDYQVELSILKIELKKSRINRDKDLTKQILQNQKIIEHRIASFSHVADAIGWQLMSGQITTARRFHIDEKGSKYLNNSNIDHAMTVADRINENPNSFALISDITNFIQIGDLLILQEGKIGVMELKEGSVNDQIADFLVGLEAKNCSLDEVNLNELFDKNTVKQIKRVVRQKVRMEQTTSLVNKEEGVDPISGYNMKIETPSIHTEYYHDELCVLSESLNEQIWAYGIVDNCLHIGMYKEAALPKAPVVIKSLLEADTENYVLVDWMSIVNNLSEPIFAKPFPPEFIIDVLTGKIKIIVGLNLDLMMKLFTDLGIETTWMSTKQTAKIKQQKISNGLVEKKNRGISMKLPDGQEMIMYGGMISKIIYDCIKPSSIAISMLSLGQVPEKGKIITDNNVK
jgi:hypothetical protein